MSAMNPQSSSFQQLADGSLRTERLELLPVTLQLALQIEKHPEQLADALEADVAPGWPGEDFVGILPSLTDLLAVDPGFAAWVRVIVRIEPREIIGTIGFIDFPDDPSLLELGYSIMPTATCQGFGSEAAFAMMAWVMRQPNTARVIAQCKANNIASIRILEKLGFQRWGHNGQMLEWQITRPQWEQHFRSSISTDGNREEQ